MNIETFQQGEYKKTNISWEMLESKLVALIAKEQLKIPRSLS